MTKRTHSGAGFVRLIRVPNLILLVTIQALVFFTGHPESMNYFLPVVLMTACAMAAGYIINALMDVDTDRLNGRVNAIANGQTTARAARKIYVLLIITGAIFSVVLSTGWSWHFLWIYVSITFLLWLYSYLLKALPVVGNIAVSVFCGMAVLIVWYPAVQFELVPQTVVLLAGFAFLVTMSREIVKDVEDMTGDLASGYRTLPLVVGVRFSNALVILLLTITSAALVILAATEGTTGAASWVCHIITLGLLIFASQQLIRRNKIHEDYHRISTVLKIAMLFGSLGLLLG